MITKQELIDSGYELIEHEETDFIACFKTNRNKYFWLTKEDGLIDTFQDDYDNYYGLTLPTPFKDIVSFNSFTNLYL